MNNSTNRLLKVIKKTGTMLDIAHWVSEQGENAVPTDPGENIEIPAFIRVAFRL
jgi:hypothetical protein